MRLMLQLEFPADARLLPMTRRALAAYLDDAGADEEDRDDVVLALDEACANVVRHAFPDAGGRIRLLAEIIGDRVCVQVEDDGVGFDPVVAPAHDNHEATSGRGLRIMRGLMSGVELESPTETGGTRVLMHKVLAGTADGPVATCG